MSCLKLSSSSHRDTLQLDGLIERARSFRRIDSHDPVVFLFHFPDRPSARSIPATPGNSKSLSRDWGAG
jgi:hypothetical protein